MFEIFEESKLKMREQNTIGRPVSYSGIGIHTGTEVSLTFNPAEADTGVVFRRVDLPSKPVIPALLDYVCDTSRSTTLGMHDVRIHTVEHVLAAIKAYRIDNVLIDISSIEPPIANGSSDVFVKMIEDAGVVSLEKKREVKSLKKPVYWSEGDIHLVALPSPDYRISYTLSYPESKVLKSQYQSFFISPETFKKELASCRTFSNYEEVSFLIDRGLIKGGSLDNAVIIKGEAVFSKGGLFFPDEMVRHKMLDLIGDLSLIGVDFIAHIISIRSGHQSNFGFGKKILETLSSERLSDDT